MDNIVSSLFMSEKWTMVEKPLSKDERCGGLAADTCLSR